MAGKIKHRVVTSIPKTISESLTFHVAEDGESYSYVRSASRVVAASDASAVEIAETDYKCDGTADEVQIQAAIDAI